MKKTISALLLLALLSGCGAQPSTTPMPNTSTNTAQNDSSNVNKDVFLEFTAKDFNGNNVDQSVFANTKLTMMNVWATFCNPCIKEMPDLGELAAAGGTDYQIIGVCADLDGTEDMLTVAKDLVSETNANYLHLQPSEVLLPVLTATSAVPVTFFFDSEGRLVGQGIAGAHDKDRWEKELQARLDMVNAAAEKSDDAAQSDIDSDAEKPEETSNATAE